MNYSLRVELGVKEVEEGLHHPRDTLERAQDWNHIEELVRLQQRAHARERSDEDEALGAKLVQCETACETGADACTKRLTHDGDAGGRD